MNIAQYCVQIIQYIGLPFSITRRRSIWCNITDRQGASLGKLYNIILKSLIVNTVIIKLFYFVCFIRKTDINDILYMYTGIGKTYTLQMRCDK